MTDEASNMVLAALMPHPPVVIPEVGRGRDREIGATVANMTALAHRIVDLRADTLVLISPHSPRRPGEFGIWNDDILRGDLSRFGASETTIEVPFDRSFAATLEEETVRSGLKTWGISSTDLDHGATVPLYYLSRAGWSGATIVLGLPHPPNGGLESLGNAIANTAHRSGLKTAILASGDMSHRLKPGAPAGFDPEAQLFDKVFVELLRGGDYRGIEGIDRDLRTRAAEDVVDSTRVALASVDFRNTGHQVLSYEGPFGVGYCVALLYESPKPDSKTVGVPDSAGDILTSVARQAVEDKVLGDRRSPAVPTNMYLAEPRGVFVTIRTREGKLCGCRGTITPRCRNLVEETRQMALSSAFQDQRFDPISKDELTHLTYEVSVLYPSERVQSPDDLDPSIYGVILSTRDGRSALMLPKVEGLDTVEQQLSATRRKAAIGPSEPIEIKRFRTDKYCENPPQT